MNELYLQALAYLRGVWRYRWWIQAIAWPICIVGWLFVWSMPDVYRAEARVYVDTENMLRPLLRGLAIQPDLSDQVAVMTRTILSKPNLEKIVRDADLHLQATTPKQMEHLLEMVKAKLEIRAGRNNLFDIAYEDSDPRVARRVVEAVLTLFMESSLGDKRQDSDMAQEFLERQVQIYEQKLIEAEDRLKEFKRRNLGRMPGAEGDYFARLQAAEADLRRVELEYKQAVRRRDELQRQLEGEVPTFGMLRQSQPQGPHPLDRRIAALEEQLDDLLLRYTEQHPDVVALKDTLARLQAQREADLARLRQSGGMSSELAENPVYQRLKVSLGQAEAEVAALEVRLEYARRQVRELREAVDVIPEVEAELAQLNRDYGIIKKKYEELVTRLESARLSEEAQRSTDTIQFKIVDPPFVPLDPVGPMRPLFMFVVLLGGLGAGVFFAFVLSQIRPVFDDTRILRSVTGYPVFGAISIIRNEDTLRRQRIEVGGYLGALAFLILVFGVFLAMQAMGWGREAMPYVQSVLGAGL